MCTKSFITLAETKFLFLRSYFLRDEHRLTVFENRRLRRTFGPKGRNTRQEKMS
jgi:hypothetical protein